MISFTIKLLFNISGVKDKKSLETSNLKFQTDSLIQIGNGFKYDVND